MIYILYAFVRSLCLGLFVLRYPVLTLQSVSSMGEVTSAAVILFVPSVVSGSELGFTSSRATQLLPPHPPETDGDGDVVDPNRRSALLRRNRLAVKKRRGGCMVKNTRWLGMCGLAPPVLSKGRLRRARWIVLSVDRGSVVIVCSVGPDLHLSLHEECMHGVPFRMTGDLRPCLI